MPELTPGGCAERRRRLLRLMESLRLDLAVVADPRDVYYFTGVLFPPDLPAALFVDCTNRCFLAGPETYDLGDDCSSYSYSWNERGTRNPHASFQLANLLGRVLPRIKAKRLGIQSDAIVHAAWRALAMLDGATFAPIDEELRTMQSRKDPDEIAMIRASIRANLGAYQAVEAAIRPGVSELEVLAAGYCGAMQAAGEKVFHDGDYQCGQYNGPARARSIEAGELYIVDAWTCRRGYWSDMARTYAVGIAPTEEQQALFDHIRWVQSQIASLLKPGVDGCEVFASLDAMIRGHAPLAAEGLIHHGGHAIGLRSHELPDINPQRGGRLEPGQVICVEPGGYFAAARHGVRLENMYLITETGCEDLCPSVAALPVCR